MGRYPYTYEQSSIDVVKVIEPDKSYWELRKQGEPVRPARYFTTKAQAYLALGLYEMLMENKGEVKHSEYERLLITNNLLITGKEWVTE